VPYELDESKGWGMNIGTLKQAVQKARADGKLVRGMVFINPGNPTGAKIRAQGRLRMHAAALVLRALRCEAGWPGGSCACVQAVPHAWTRRCPRALQARS